MSVKEKMLELIREKTGNPNADLWTLQFDHEKDSKLISEGKINHRIVY